METTDLIRSNRQAAMKRQHAEKAKVWGRLKDATWTPRASVLTRHKNPNHRCGHAQRPSCSLHVGRSWQIPAVSWDACKHGRVWLSSDPAQWCAASRCVAAPGQQHGTLNWDTLPLEPEGRRWVPRVPPSASWSRSLSCGYWFRPHPRSPGRGRKWFVF